jgi:hypothetical protein
MQNLIKIRTLKDELFQAEGLAGGQTHDKLNSPFSQFSERV